MKKVLKLFLVWIAFLLSINLAANASTYERLLVYPRYSNHWTAIDVRMGNVKVTPSSSFRSVAFELHSHRNYGSKIYIEVSGQTFGYGKIPTNLSYQRRGDFYIHANNSDPVSLRRLNGVLDEENRLVLRGVCQFVTDPSNLEIIFDTAIKSSNGKSKEYWQRYQKRMAADIRRVGRNCLNKLGGPKIVFTKTKAKRNSSNASTKKNKNAAVSLKDLNNVYFNGTYNCSMTDRGKFKIQLRQNKAVLINGPATLPKTSIISEETSKLWVQKYNGITRKFSVNILKNALRVEPPLYGDTIFLKSVATASAPCEIYLTGLIPSTTPKEARKKGYAEKCNLSSNTIKKAQVQLKRLDLYPYKIDGIAGKGTLAGIAKAKILIGPKSSSGECFSKADIIAWTELANINEEKSANPCTSKNPEVCTDLYLCGISTKSENDIRVWWKPNGDASSFYTNFINEAARRALKCNVGQPYREKLTAKNVGFANKNVACQNKNFFTVSAAQERLEKLGYFSGKIDGLIGDKTRKSYIKFEKFLGKELASEDGCLNKEELRWLIVIANAKRKGIRCSKPSIDYEKFLSVQKFFKDKNLYEGQFPTQQSDIRSFTRAVIRLELEAEKILGTSVKKNCQIDESEESIIITYLDAEQSEEATETLVSTEDQNTKDVTKDINTAEPNQSDAGAVTEVKEKKVCSVDDISQCLVTEICAQAILTDQGVSTIKRDNNPFTEHLINQAKENTIDKICGFQNVLDMAEPNEMIIMITDFLKSNPGSFDLELSLKLEPVRSLGPPDKVDSSSREYRELIAYLKKNLGFEQYVAQTIRTANRQSKENLARVYELAVEEMNKLEKWATENLLDPRAAKIAKLKAEFNSVELEKTNTLIVDEFLLKIAVLKDSLKPKDNTPENTQMAQAQKNNNEVQNNQDSEIKARLRGFTIEEVVKEYGDGFDNFLAPRNFTLARVSLSFDSFGQEVTIDGDRLYLITENGQRISPNEEATNAYLAQIGGKNVKFKNIEISKNSLTLVFIIPISEKSNENLKLIYDEKSN